MIYSHIVLFFIGVHEIAALSYSHIVLFFIGVHEIAALSYSSATQSGRVIHLRNSI